MEKKRSCCCGGLPAMWWWLITLLGLPLLFLLMTGLRQGVIEHDLTTRTQAALQKAGFDWANINLAGRGRDVQLVGNAPSEAERQQALQLVQNVNGVRDVQNLLKVEAATAAVAATTDAGAVLSSAADSQAAAAKVAEEQAAAVKAAEEQAAAAKAAEEQAAAAKAAEEQAAAAKAAEEQAAAAKVAEEQAAAAKAAEEQAAAQTKPMTPEQAVIEKAANNCQAQLDAAMTGKTILFETNKAAIKRDSLALLDSLAGVLTSCTEVIVNRGIQVAGHTDSVGNDAYNQKLSEQRANAVKDYLVGKGIDAALIKAVGYGETQPIASNDNEAGRSKNRRITFDINPL